MHVYLIGPYSKQIRQQNPISTVINNNSIPTCMTMIDLATGWFNIFEIPTFDLNDIALDNDEYIYKRSTRVSQIFNKPWICR